MQSRTNTRETLLRLEDRLSIIHREGERDIIISHDREPRPCHSIILVLYVWIQHVHVFGRGVVETDNCSMFINSLYFVEQLCAVELAPNVSRN